MLLYRPLIIDWLPVPLPACPTKPPLLHPPPSPTLSLSPCLIVSPLILSVSFSSLSCLLLFLSFSLSLFFFYLPAASLLQAWRCWAQLFAAVCYIAGAQVLVVYRERVSAYYSPLQLLYIVRPLQLCQRYLELLLMLLVFHALFGDIAEDIF